MPGRDAIPEQWCPIPQVLAARSPELAPQRSAAMRRINGELAGIAERVAGQAEAVVHTARCKLRTLGEQASGRARAVVDQLEQTAGRTRKIAAQTRQRLAGTVPDGASRVVSLHDADARPIVKGRLGKPVEFGYKAQLVDNEDGVVLDHRVEPGNPPDGPMLEPAIQRIKKRAGRAPRAVTADRGYGEQGVEEDLRHAGVRYIVLPTKGRPTAARRQIENRRAFRKMLRWRTGGEGRISCLERDFGLARTRLDGLAGAQTWCGHGIFAHNLIKISGLIGEPNLGPVAQHPDPTDIPNDAQPSRALPHSTYFFRSK
jgi:IS5 family transposase